MEGERMRKKGAEERGREVFCTHRNNEKSAPTKHFVPPVDAKPIII